MAKAVWESLGERLVLGGDWVQENLPEIWSDFSQLTPHSVDFSKVSRIDSAGLAAIITAFVAQPRATPLAFVNGSLQLKQLLALYGLEPLVTLATSEQPQGE